MPESFQFAEILSFYIARSAYTAGQLASLTGLPRTTIVNWQNGRVLRPRDWQSVVKLLAVLHVNETEANEVLQAARQPTLAELAILATQETDKGLLATWVKPPESPIPLSPFQAIADIPYFVGREEIMAQLTEQLVSRKSHTICTVQGMAGTGKTVLAARLAYQLRSHFPDGVLWARLDTSDTMSILHTFALAYGADVSRYTEVTSRSRVVRNLLADKQALIIFDNVQDSLSVEPLLPPTGKCAILITTRHSDLRIAQGAFRLVLPPFAPKNESSLQLFTHFLGSARVKEEKPTLEAISQRVGHLPLALAIIAGRLTYEPGWTSQDFLNRLQQASRRLKELHYEDQSIRLAFSQSFALLSDEERPFFTILSLFGGEDFSANGAAAGAAIPLEDAEDRLRSLYRLSLVQQGRIGRYRLHSLLRDFARENLTDKGATLRIALYFQALIEQGQTDPASLIMESDNILSTLEMIRGQGEAAAFIKLTLAFTPFLLLQGMDAGAQQNLYFALDMAKGEQQLPILLNLARLARSQRAYEEANRYLETAVSLTNTYTEINYTCAIYTEKGIIAGCRGQYHKARDYFERGLPLAREQDEPNLLVPLLKELGASEVAHANYDQAETYYAEAISLARQTYPAHIPALLRCLGGIAISRDQNYNQAQTYYEKGLSHARILNSREDSLFLLKQPGCSCFSASRFRRSGSAAHRS